MMILWEKLRCIDFCLITRLTTKISIKQVRRNMTTISRLVEGGPAVVLAHAYVTSHQRNLLEFEALEVDVRTLHKYLGVKQFLTCDGNVPFWGELVAVTPCTSTHPGLGMLRDRPTLRGTFRIFPNEPSSVQ